MVKRPYRSPRREEQAQLTRAAVVEASHRLFVLQGYAATSIRQIAEAARVSEQTVYRLFGDKPSLLRSVILTAVGGSDEPTVARETQLMARLAETATPSERLRLVADWIREGYERGLAELEYVVLSAAPIDERVCELARFMAEQRYEDARSLVLAVLGDTSRAAGDTQVDDMVDYIYAVESSSVYRLLVGDRGWSTQRYVEWFVRLVERMFADQLRGE